MSFYFPGEVAWSADVALDRSGCRGSAGGGGARLWLHRGDRLGLPVPDGPAQDLGAEVPQKGRPELSPSTVPAAVPCHVYLGM